MNRIEWLLLIVLCLLGAFCALWIEEPAVSLQKDYLGVSGYPLIIGCALAGACLLRLAAVGNGEGEEGNSSSRIVRPILLATAYVGGIAFIGFLISTFLYLAFMPLLLDREAGAKCLGRNLFYALAVTAVMCAFFRFFKIYLPETILF